MEKSILDNDAIEVGLSSTVGTKKEGFLQFCEIKSKDMGEISFWMRIDKQDVPEEGTFVIGKDHSSTVSQVISAFCGHEEDEISYGELKSLINIWEDDANYFSDKFKIYKMSRNQHLIDEDMSQEEKYAWSTLADMLRGPLPQLPVIDCIAPGQIWSTKGSDKEFVSPNILIIGVNDDHGCVRALQIHDSEFYSNTDIEVTPGNYAELWNKFSVANVLLDKCIDVIPDDILVRCHCEVDDVEVYGDDREFRQFEIGVSSRLALESLGYMNL